MFALPAAFAGLEPNDAEEVQHYLQMIELSANEVLITQGDDDGTMAFVLRGAMTIERDGVRIGGAGARDMLGEVEFFCQIPRRATVSTINNSTILALTPDAYAALCESGNPGVFGLERAALKRICNRLRAVNSGLTEIGVGVDARVQPKKKGFFEKISERFRASPEADVLEALKAGKPFSWAQASFLQPMSNSFEVQCFDEQELLLTQGSSTDHLFLVIEGTVEIMSMTGGSTAEIIRTAQPGELIGVDALEGAGNSSFSAICREPVLGAVLSKESFSTLYTADDEVGSVFRQGLIRSVGYHLGDAIDRYVELMKETNVETEERLRGTPISMVWRD